MHMLNKKWDCMLAKSQFSQIVSAYGFFQGNFFMSDLQICEKLLDVRFMLRLIFHNKVFLCLLQ